MSRSNTRQQMSLEIEESTGDECCHLSVWKKEVNNMTNFPIGMNMQGSSQVDMPSSLDETTEHKRSSGFLSF